MTTLDILAPEIFVCEKTFRSFCEAVSCEGDQNLIECWFNEWYGKEILYFVSRKGLEKRLPWKVNENRKNCGFCEECKICARTHHIRMCLDDAYYFKPRKDAPFQPIRWKVCFSAVHSLKNFLDCKNSKGNNINWHKEWFFSFFFRCIELLIEDIWLIS